MIRLTTGRQRTLRHLGALAAGRQQLNKLLVRIRLVPPRDPDPVVREFIVRLANLDLRHVTSRAARFRDFANSGAGLPSGRMARPTALVIKRGRLDRFRMGIVAGGAPDSRVRRVIALAVSKTVRLKADVCYVMRPVDGDL